MLNPIVYAAPVFILMIGLEFAWGRWRGQTIYRAADTVSSLAAGITSQLIEVFSKTFTVGIYTLAWQQLALLPLRMDALWVWLLALLLYDLCYYWYHRLGHEVALLWAAHAVHHSSEEYNLSTALRQTGTGFLFSWIFYLPLAVLGVPPLVFGAVALIDLLYQFWVHTRLVGRLGWFDRVFVSPSNHRVHHGQNAYCLDRNYGGILILWDRLFGSFVEERADEPIVYGVLGQLRRWNPLSANLHVYAERWRDMRMTARWRDKLALWFRHPDWRPADLERLAPKPVPDLRQFHRYAPPLPAGLPIYGLVHLFIQLGLGVLFLALAPGLALSTALPLALGLAAGLVLLTQLLEDPQARRAGEMLRLIVSALACAWLLQTAPSAAMQAFWATGVAAFALSVPLLGVLLRRPLTAGAVR